MVSRGREGRETSCGRAASPDTESLTDSPAQPPDARSGTRLNPRSELDLMRLDGDPDRTARPPPRRPGRTGELSPDRDRSPDDAVTEDLQAMCVSLLGAAGHGLSVPATSGRGCERPSERPGERVGEPHGRHQRRPAGLPRIALFRSPIARTTEPPTGQSQNCSLRALPARRPAESGALVDGRGSGIPMLSPGPGHPLSLHQAAPERFSVLASHAQDVGEVVIGKSDPVEHVRQGEVQEAALGLIQCEVNSIAPEVGDHGSITDRFMFCSTARTKLSGP